MFGFFLMVLLMARSVSTAADNSVRITCSSNGSLCLGKSFKLTCSSECLSTNTSMEMAKDGITVSTITLYSTAPATNCTLNLFIQNATETDSGRYSCSTPKSLSSLLLNISACPPVASSRMPTRDPPAGWNLQSTLMWYLLCKTGVFLMCSMSAVLKYSCKIR